MIQNMVLLMYLQDFVFLGCNSDKLTGKQEYLIHLNESC